MCRPTNTAMARAPVPGCCRRLQVNDSTSPCRTSDWPSVWAATGPASPPHWYVSGMPCLRRRRASRRLCVAGSSALRTSTSVTPIPCRWRSSPAGPHAPPPSSCCATQVRLTTSYTSTMDPIHPTPYTPGEGVHTSLSAVRYYVPHVRMELYE